MMLRHLGAAEAADAVEVSAIARNAGPGDRSARPNIGGNATTKELGTAIAAMVSGK